MHTIVNNFGGVQLYFYIRDKIGDKIVYLDIRNIRIKLFNWSQFSFVVEKLTMLYF